MFSATPIHFGYTIRKSDNALLLNNPENSSEYIVVEKDNPVYSTLKHVFPKPWSLTINCKTPSRIWIETFTAQILNKAALLIATNLDETGTATTDIARKFLNATTKTGKLKPNQKLTHLQQQLTDIYSHWKPLKENSNQKQCLLLVLDHLKNHVWPVNWESKPRQKEISRLRKNIRKGLDFLLKNPPQHIQTDKGFNKPEGYYWLTPITQV